MTGLPRTPLHRLWIHFLHTVHLTEFACTPFPRRTTMCTLNQIKGIKSTSIYTKQNYTIYINNQIDKFLK